MLSDPILSPKEDAPLIAVHDLEFQRHGRPILQIPLWQVDPGRHAVVVGPSGSGKTTLLHLTAGLLTSSGNAIRFGGFSLAEMTQNQRDRFRGAHIGMVFQKFHLIDALDVRANLAIARYLAGLPADPERVASLLASLELSHRAHAYPPALSHGEAQRLAIGRALMNRPALILADEPTAALDDRQCERVLDLLFEHATSAQATLVVATHDHRVRQRFDHRLVLGEDV